MNDKLWIYDIKQLINSAQLIPKETDPYVQKLNTVVRLTIVVALLVSCWKPQLAVGLLFAVSMATVISHSSTVKEIKELEGFEDCNSCAFNYQTIKGKTSTDPEVAAQQLSEFMKEYASSGPHNISFRNGFPITQKRFCNDEKLLNFDCSYQSPNQTLAGPANSKTRIAPIIAAPCYDFDSWKINDFAVLSQINDSTNFDQYRAGYNYGTLPAKCKSCYYAPCKCLNNEFKPVSPTLQTLPISENVNKNGCNGSLEYTNTFNCTPCSTTKNILVQYPNVIQQPNTSKRLMKENFSDILPLKPTTNFSIIKQLITQLQEKGGDVTNYMLVRNYVHQMFREKNLGKTEDKEIDEILQMLNNNVSSINSHKVISNACFESEERDNLLTNTLVPGVYQKTHIGEPIQSNMGISFVQDWGPVEVQETPWEIKYTEHDPKNVTVTQKIKKNPIEQNVSNVYDPRLTGYGTSYRGYTDELTGQPRFFYDDITAITMPNYITRNNVDIYPWAPTYGPNKPLPDLDEHRQLANNAFSDSAIVFRTEMMERLMRKKNAEHWQRRAMPITTMNQASSGFMRSAI